VRKVRARGPASRFRRSPAARNSRDYPFKNRSGAIFNARDVRYNKNQKLSTALWRLFADLPPQDFDCGGSARHHHSFGVEAALVQGGAPVFEFAEDVDFAVRGAGSGVVKLMYGHAAE
jgi:hypothetical protein